MVVGSLIGQPFRRVPSDFDQRVEGLVFAGFDEIENAESKEREELTMPFER